MVSQTQQFAQSSNHKAHTRLLEIKIINVVST